MARLQKVEGIDLTGFLNQNLSELDTRQKYLLFQKLEIPISFAISKAMSKFHSLPVEKDDFTSIAWMAFENALQKYKKGLFKKGFTSYIIDSVYWKSMDYALSLINNHHKVLNGNIVKLNWIENPNPNDDLGKKITIRLIVEDYFQSLPNNQITFRVFSDYVYQIPLIEICKKYQISRNRVKRILTKTISDLGKLLA